MFFDPKCVGVFCKSNWLKFCTHIDFIEIEIRLFRFGSLLNICVNSVGSKVQKNAFTSNVQNHPKGAAKGKLKESASHHVKRFVRQNINFTGLVRFSRLLLTFGVLEEKLRFFDFFDP